MKQSKWRKKKTTKDTMCAYYMDTEQSYLPMLSTIQTNHATGPFRSLDLCDTDLENHRRTQSRTHHRCNTTVCAQPNTRQVLKRASMEGRYPTMILCMLLVNNVHKQRASISQVRKPLPQHGDHSNGLHKVHDNLGTSSLRI